MSRTPLDLYGEVTTATGARFKLDANQGPGSRPLNLRFGTKIGEGFGDSSFQLPRRIDRDYPDLSLVNNVVFRGADGTVAYEGRLAAMPRELADRHSIGVTLAGYMAHAKDRRFAEIYVDRDVGQWGSIPLNEQARLLTGGVDIGSLSSSRDVGGIVFPLPNQALGAFVLAAAWYSAPPGMTVAKLGYRGTQTSVPVGWTGAELVTTAADSYDGSAIVALTLDDTLRTTTITTPKRYINVGVYSNATAATPATGANRTYKKIAVYGNHGLTLHTGDTTEPDGVYVSDVMRDIARRFCPDLDVSGVQDTSYVVQHCAYRERTYPYDAFLDLNKYHLWNLGVWENKRLDFKPYDLTDYDWEIRTDDPGTTFSPQGPSTENLYNGIEVIYTNVLTGAVEVLLPTDYTQLADTSSTNPWNQWGRQKWDTITLSQPTLPAQALELGRAALADSNRPRTPGTITVRGYIRDRAGAYQPCWKPRAGDTIAITNFPNDTPRLIVETDYDDESKTLRLSIDQPFALLEAYLDRQTNALQAAGLA